jgi:imidazolonepropionase-like amidohydrolase
VGRADKTNSPLKKQRSEDRGARDPQNTEKTEAVETMHHRAANEFTARALRSAHSLLRSAFSHFPEALSLVAPRYSLLALLIAMPVSAQSTVIHTSRVLDGRGKTLTDVDILVENGKITRVGPRIAVPAGATQIDLRGRTVLPGLIDAHVHFNWYFNAQGRYHSNGDGEGPAELAAAMDANAKATLLAGFTTVQSLGAMQDLAARERINSGKTPGPRLLTSIYQLQGGERNSPDSLRARVRRVKELGGEVVKIFASGSIRDGGQLSMTQDQINAACDEARKVGLRTAVHAHSAESIRAVIAAGCNQIEHGVFATQAELDLMAQHNVYFDPQCSLIFRNYLDNRDKYNGIGNFNDAGFASMEKAIPIAAEVIRNANRTKGLKVVYGTDAVAGAHGRNAEDLVCRVQTAGEDPMHAIIAATSLTAESMGLGARIGFLAAGYEADIIAMNGDPIEDITAVRKVSFVMKGGTVYRDDGKTGAR